MFLSVAYNLLFMSLYAGQPPFPFSRNHRVSRKSPVFRMIRRLQRTARTFSPRERSLTLEYVQLFQSGWHSQALPKRFFEAAPAAHYSAPNRLSTSPTASRARLPFSTSLAFEALISFVAP